MKKIQNVFEDLIDAKRIVREIRLLHFLNHPAIIKLVDVEKPKDLSNFNDIYFSTDRIMAQRGAPELTSRLSYSCRDFLQQALPSL